MATKLYVGNLSFDTTQESLTQAFSQAGTAVSASIVMDKFNPTRSRGFGFVEMGTEEEAQAAIEMWNGKDLDGRQIVVNEARPLEDRPRRTGGFNRDDRGGSSRGGFNRGGSNGGSRGGNRW